MSKPTTLEDTPQSVPQDTPAALGAFLAKARMERGLELREVAVRLGLNPVLIRHLETGDFNELGAPVYVRGYISRYVRLLELPEQSILERFRKLGTNEPPPLKVTRSIKPQARMTDTSVRWFSYLLVIAFLGWIAWLAVQDAAPLLTTLTQGSFTPSVSKPETATNQPAGEPVKEPGTATNPPPVATTAAAPPVAGPAPTAPAASPAPTAPTANPASTAPTANPASTASVTSPVSTPPAATPTAVTAAPAGASSPPVTSVGTVTPIPPPVAATSPPTSGTATDIHPEPTVTAAASPVDQPGLVIEFKEDSWVEVKDATGKRLAYGTMKANTVSTLSGTTPFSIILGNAPGVNAIRLNGKPVAPELYLPKRGTVSRFVVKESS